MPKNGSVVLQLYRRDIENVEGSGLRPGEPVLCRNEHDAWSQAERLLGTNRVVGARIIRISADGASTAELIAKIGKVLDLH